MSKGLSRFCLLLCCTRAKPWCCRKVDWKCTILDIVGIMGLFSQLVGLLEKKMAKSSSNLESGRMGTLQWLTAAVCFDLLF